MLHTWRRRPSPQVFLALILVTLVGSAGLQEPQAGRLRDQPAGSSPTRHVDRAALMSFVRTLTAPALQGRRTGSPGGRQARRILQHAFASAGLRPAGTEDYLQPFRFTQRSALGAILPLPPWRVTYADAANVVGRVDGTERGLAPLVVSAHYDHLGVERGLTFPGADDNASGVAVLVAAARHFAAHPPSRPMVLVAFDAEELGLRGAKHFLSAWDERSPPPALNVNLDMVSRSERRELFAVGTHHSPWLRPLIEDVQRRSAVTIRFGHDQPGAPEDGLDDWTQQSDHGAFHERGIPFLYFGVEDHADYHQPTDTADRIDPRFFGDAADAILEALLTIDARGVP